MTGAPRLPSGGLASLNPKLTIVRKVCAKDRFGNLVLTFCAVVLLIVSSSSSSLIVYHVVDSIVVNGLMVIFPV